ncbi:hypothetical protein [Pontibacter rugosus]|uniref:Cbb3-type cytochrome oxidase component FixQ n=1 Tax=Pontibacter rugosus TaxID=1745966 RepID=A0ABW3SUG0_9BACT
MGKNKEVSIWLIGATIVAISTAVYLYLGSVLEEEDIDLDLSEEDESAYL